MKVLIIDDEINSRELLNTLLYRYCNGVTEVWKASSVATAIEKININKPDLVFLDIEMPGGNGFNLLDHFNKAEFLTCFTTGYESYAIKAIEYGAFGYLLKPIDLDRLKKLVDKAKGIIDSKEYTSSIILQETEKIHSIKEKDIIYLESEGNYCFLMLKDGSKVISSKNLSYFEEILSENLFYRTHKSFVINLSYISVVTEGRTGSATMSDGKVIPIASRRFKGFTHRYKSIDW